MQTIGKQTLRKISLGVGEEEKPDWDSESSNPGDKPELPIIISTAPDIDINMGEASKEEARGLAALKHDPSRPEEEIQDKVGLGREGI